MIPFSLLILTSKRGKDFCTVLFFLCNHKTPYHSTWYNFFVNGALHTLSISIIGTEIYHLLEGSCLHLFFWDFDPEAHPGLKNPLDQSEILIRRNFRKHRFDADRNYIKKVCQIISRNDSASPALDPKRYFIDPRKDLSFGWQR